MIPTEIKQSGDYGSITSPLLVRKSSTMDSVNDSDTNIAKNNSVSVVPSTYGDRGQFITRHPFLGTMSLWQNFFIAWLRMCNEFFRYPAISGETWFLKFSVFVQRK